MRFPDYFNDLTGAQKRELAERAKTSVIYLYHLAAGIKRPSLKMAEKLQTATGDVVRLQDWELRRPAHHPERRA